MRSAGAGVLLSSRSRVRLAPGAPPCERPSAQVMPSRLAGWLFTQLSVEVLLELGGSGFEGGCLFGGAAADHDREPLVGVGRGLGAEGDAGQLGYLPPDAVGARCRGEQRCCLTAGGTGEAGHVLYAAYGGGGVAVQICDEPADVLVGDDLGGDDQDDDDLAGALPEDELLDVGGSGRQVDHQAVGFRGPGGLGYQPPRDGLGQHGLYAEGLVFADEEPG